MVRSIALLSILILVGCQVSKPCDPVWDSSCANPNPSTSGSSGSSSSSSNTTITTTRTQDSLPSQLQVNSSFDGSPDILATTASSGTIYVFSAKIHNNTFSPSFAGTSFATSQVRLMDASSYKFLSPSQGNCVISSNPFLVVSEGGSEQVMQIMVQEVSDGSCATFLTSMKTGGFQAQFTTVPDNVGGNINQVTFTVTP